MKNNIPNELLALRNEDEYFHAGDLPDDFELVEDGGFVQDGKYQSATSIVKHTVSGRYFEIRNYRSGSYHTDWYYDTADVNEVLRKEVQTIRIEWIAV